MACAGNSDNLDEIITKFNKTQSNDSSNDIENLTISEYINNMLTNNTDEIDDDSSENTYPEPSPLRISTLTGTCTIDSNINLLVLSQYLELNKYITYINYGDIVSKGVNITPTSAKRKKTKRVFYNQITIIVKHENDRFNNIKLFANGAVSMTGLQSIEEGEKSINIILDELRTINGKILFSITDSYYNSKIKKDDDDVKLECVGCKQPFTYYAMKLSDVCGHYICNVCADEHTCCPKEGCNTSYVMDALDNKSAKIKDINIVLINSDYKANFKINQKKLHPIIVHKYKIFSTFEPTIYPGVKSMYYWNKDYRDNPIKGKCYCTKSCNGKGNGNGNGQCKKVTTAVFQSGSVLITGGRSLEQIQDGYNFINTILKNEFNSIRKITAKFVEENTIQKIVTKPVSKRVKLYKPSIINYPDPATIALIISKLAA